MSVGLFWRFRVKDFDSWLNPDPDGLEQMFKQQGMQAYTLHRSIDDPNSVMFYAQFPDEATAHAFEAWYKTSSVEYVKQYPGSETEIVMSWVGRDVEGYSR